MNWKKFKTNVEFHFELQPRVSLIHLGGQSATYLSLSHRSVSFELQGLRWRDVF